MAKTKTKSVKKPKKKGGREKDTIKRLERIVGILCMLDKRPVNLKELSAYYGVDVKTIQLDMNLVKKRFNIDRLGRTCNYAFAEGESLSNRSFTQNNEFYEIFASLVALAISQGFPEENLKGMLKTLGMDSAPGANNIRPIAPRVIAAKIPFNKELQEAIDGRKVIALKYQSRPDAPVKEHTLCPVKILIADGFYYVFGFYKKDPAATRRYPKYRLDRVSDIKVLDETFDMPGDSEDELDGARSIWGIQSSSQRGIDIKLSVSGYARDYFRTHDLVEGQQIDEQPDGTLLFTARIGMLEEIIPQVLRWMPHVKVLETRELKEAVAAQIKAYSDN